MIDHHLARDSLESCGLLQVSHGPVINIVLFDVGIRILNVHATGMFLFACYLDDR